MPTVTEKRPEPARRRVGIRRSSAETSPHWCSTSTGRSPTLPARWASSSRRWATGSARSASIAGEREGLTSEERDELARLRREVKRLGTERELLKHSMCGSSRRHQVGLRGARGRRLSRGCTQKGRGTSKPVCRPRELRRSRVCPPSLLFHRWLEHRSGRVGVKRRLHLAVGDDEAVLLLP